jgi:hypothetical protein
MRIAAGGRFAGTTNGTLVKSAEPAVEVRSENPAGNCSMRARSGARGADGGGQVANNGPPVNKTSFGFPDASGCLSRHAKATCFLIDLTQQVRGKIDVHPLHRPAGTLSLGGVHLCGQIDSSVVHGIERRRGKRLTSCGTHFLLHGVLSSPK